MRDPSHGRLRQQMSFLRRQFLQDGDRAFSDVLLLQGLGVLSIILAVFFIALKFGNGELDARTLSFTTLIVANLGLILANRSWIRSIVSTLQTSNAALWWVVDGAVVFLAAVLYVPLLRDLFHFSTLHPNDLLICIAGGGFSILWFEAMKVWGRMR